MPRLVILNAGPDTAGCGIALKRAFDKHAVGWQTRAVCRSVKSLDYPTDIVWPRRTPYIRRKVEELVRRADVVHVMDAPRVLNAVVRGLHGQTVIVQHLGSHYRMNPAGVSAQARSFGASEATDSIDLLADHIAWMPATRDLDELAELRQRVYRPSQRIRIAHAPTNRLLKHTAAVIVAVEQLAKRHPIDFDLIEGVSNRECLERKAQADIFIDQLLFGFGVNNIECWAMGIPVVSGLADDDAHRKAVKMWGRLPWADANAATLEPIIEHLVTDPAWRAMLGERGRAHAEEWHSERSVVEQTLAVYEKARLRMAA